jgi:phenylacetate-CoA ligase
MHATLGGGCEEFNDAEGILLGGAHRSVRGLTASPRLSARGLARLALREGRSFRRLLGQMQTRERWDVDRMRAYQDERLHAILATCSQHVPYYIELFRREGLDPDWLPPRELLTRLPPLEKSEVRRDPERFRNQSTHRRLLRKAYTSGTTGSSLLCWRDLNSINFENATIWRQRRWAGVGFEDRRITLRWELPVPASRTSPPYWRYDAAQRDLIMSTYHLGPRSAPDYAAALAAFAPRALEGYPSALALLARLLREMGIESFPVRAIITTAETLLDSQRAIIESFFGAKVFDHYGNAERTAKIFACEQGSYHVQPDYSIVEFLDDGEVVGTPLFNDAFPLLRYRSGDLAVPEPEGNCSCGRPAFPIVKEIQGRRDAYVITPEGRVIGHLGHIYEEIEHVMEGQIVQESDHRVVLRVVRESGYQSKDEALLLRQARELLGPGMDIDVSYVDKIPRTARGKLIGTVGLQAQGVELYGAGPTG